MSQRILSAVFLTSISLFLSGCGDAWTAITQPASPGAVEMAPGPLPVGGSASQAAISTKPQSMQVDNLINGNNTATKKSGSAWADHVAVSGVLNVDGASATAG